MSERELIERQELRPVDAPGPLSADLHRYFCGPYCPKCGFVGPFRGPPSPDAEWCGKCGDATVPGLHTRDPRTKVEVGGLYYCNERKMWFMTGLFEIELDCPVEIAADLLVMGVVKAWIAKHGPTGCGFELLAAAVATIRSKNLDCTFPEAVAIAYHRMLDAEEQGRVLPTGRPDMRRSPNG